MPQVQATLEFRPSGLLGGTRPKLAYSARDKSPQFLLGEHHSLARDSIVGVDLIVERFSPKSELAGAKPGVTAGS